MLLSGGSAGDGIELRCDLSDGEVHRDRSATPDEKAPLFSRAARLITITLTLCVVALAVIVVAQDDSPPPIGCEGGTLTLTGSTAFGPVLREVAEKYEKDCAREDPRIEVDPHGSTSGVRELAAAGARSEHGSPPVVALSDGPKPSGMPELRENRIAVSVFALVVNEDVRLRDLSTADVRRLYRGEIANWSELGGPDLPVHLVSRDANSGTRQVFQRRVLGRGEIANSSVDCVHKDDPAGPVIRCELGSTEQVLATVAELPGAIGYSELNSAARAKGPHRLALDGHPAEPDRQPRRPVLLVRRRHRGRDELLSVPGDRVRLHLRAAAGGLAGVELPDVSRARERPGRDPHPRPSAVLDPGGAETVRPAHALRAVSTRWRERARAVVLTA